MEAVVEAIGAVLASVSVSPSRIEDDSSRVVSEPGEKGLWDENRPLEEAAIDLLDDSGEYGKRAEEVEEKSGEVAEEPLVSEEEETNSSSSLTELLYTQSVTAPFAPRPICIARSKTEALRALDWRFVETFLLSPALGRTKGAPGGRTVFPTAALVEPFIVRGTKLLRDKGVSLDRLASVQKVREMRGNVKRNGGQ